jgi:hypothetical protein
MSDEIKERLHSISAPYKRQILLDDVRFESGMRLMRVTIREGHRFTIMDIDAQTALVWAEAMKNWAETVTPTDPIREDSEH